jgi:hypothetical protein
LNPTKAAEGNRREARGGQAKVGDEKVRDISRLAERPEGPRPAKRLATIFGEGFSRRDARGGAPIRADPVCDRKRVARVPWMPPADAIEAI